MAATIAQAGQRIGRIYAWARLVSMPEQATPTSDTDPATAAIEAAQEQERLDAIAAEQASIEHTRSVQDAPAPPTTTESRWRFVLIGRADENDSYRAQLQKMCGPMGETVRRAVDGFTHPECAADLTTVTKCKSAYSETLRLETEQKNIETLLMAAQNATGTARVSIARERELSDRAGVARQQASAARARYVQARGKMASTCSVPNEDGAWTMAEQAIGARAELARERFALELLGDIATSMPSVVLSAHLSRQAQERRS